MIYRICSRCGKRIQTDKPCECMNKRYKEEDRHNKRSGNDKSFYHTAEWERARSLCISRCNGIDLYALYILKRIEYGDTVHHIVPLQECNKLRSAPDNLIYLSNRNHQKVELEYRKGNKENMQEILKGCLKRWNESTGGI